MNFYVTLPSNSVPGSKTPDYTVRLPHKIQLDGDWEVALVEMSYPYSWNNMSSGQNHILITMVTGTRLHVYVPPNNYERIDDLLHGITYGIEATAKHLRKYLRKHSKRDTHNVFNTLGGRKLLKEFGQRAGKATEKPMDYELTDNIHFTYNYTLKRVMLSVNSNVIQSVQLSKHLKYALGFDTQILEGNRNTAKHPIDLRAGIDGLYVYCNLIESQIVGGFYVPLLRVVHVDGQYGDIVEKIYHSPHYVSVLCKDFDHIEINIKSDTNQSIPFEFGKVVVKLHFRKRSVFVK